jgi:hypothetical protein
MIRFVADRPVFSAWTATMVVTMLLTHFGRIP